MSVNNFFLEHGYTPENRYTAFDATTTLSIWTPRSGNRVCLTGLSITNNAAAGTLLIVFDHPNATKIAEVTVGASLTITPTIGAIMSTVVGGAIFARPSSSPTNGWRVWAQGFELPSV